MNPPCSSKPPSPGDPSAISGHSPISESDNAPIWPELIRDEAELDEFLTRPGARLTETIRTVPSPLIVLGAGGKMGPTLAVLARRAAAAAGHSLEVIAVSRFTDQRARQWLEDRGVRTIPADLLDRSAVARLPDAANVIYLVGRKFGTQGNPSLSWALNTLVPANIAERYPGARIVALSTGNVYPFVPVTSDGATEETPLTPLGEYANAAVARERVFEHFSHQNGTHIALIRLNYAVELRYGVLVDIARRIRAGEPVDLTNGWFNCIWQGDANELILRALPLASAPAQAWNLTGPAKLEVRGLAQQFSALLDRPARFTGTPSDTALLSNPAKLCGELGEPRTPLDTILRWTAHWVSNGGRLLDKPTHFEVRDGKY
jgi:nucleoside-diphosphate-sugar epimerase